MRRTAGISHPVVHYLMHCSHHSGISADGLSGVPGALTLFAQAFRSLPEAIARRRLTAVAAVLRLLIFEHLDPRL